jgi:hypothetical protein
MVQTGHAAAAVMAVVAAASDGERLPPLPLVMGFWGGKKKVFPLAFRAVAKCRG